MAHDRAFVLFDAYIDAMLTRRRAEPLPGQPAVAPAYGRAETLHWLGWLARSMREHNQTQFRLDRLQPTAQRRAMRLWSGLVVGLVVGLVGVLVFVLSGVLSGGLVFGLLLGLLCVLQDEIHPVEARSWSWSAARAALRLSLVLGLVFGVAGGVAGGLALGLAGVLVGVLVGVLGSVLAGVLSAGALKRLSPTSHTPNEGIRRSAKYAAAGSLAGLVGVLVVGLVFGLVVGLVFGLEYGGAACVQHLVLRVMLVRGGHTPWRYVRFLDYAAERVLLRRVGGAYEFIHPLLLDHFASLQPAHLGERPAGQLS